MDKLSFLKQYFGHNGFRPGQEPLVDALLDGRDVMGIMPTGAGKSICYQLPALLLPGTALVISPLISLMKDQVAALSQAGIPAAFINSSLDPEAYREVFRRTRRGEFKLLYVAPERLQAESFLRLAGEIQISLLAVDEAHCVSQWGQDFRPSYLQIAELLASLPERPVVGAFTATATDRVREDIERLLDLRNPLRITTGFDRPNLFFEVERPKDKTAWLLDFLARRPGECGIVYCATRKTVDAVWQALDTNGIPAARYHAGMSDQERRQNQEAFVYDQVRVMTATNAFGMGIDKSNVGFVVHYNMPKDLESYYQEAGRAGRDGSPARCVLLFAPGDVQTAKFLIQNSRDDNGSENAALARLERMEAYCKTSACLRAELLRYFGESRSGNCGSCGNCTGDFSERDITIEAQKILSAVARVERKYRSSFGASIIIRLLRGSRDRRILQLGLDRLPTHGVMRGVPVRQIQDYIDVLLAEGCLVSEGSKYPVLRLTRVGKDVLFRGKTVSIRERVEKSPRKAVPRPSRASVPDSSAPLSASGDSAASTPDSSLFSALKALRTRLAREAGVPAYMIFSNATLNSMSIYQPTDLAEFLQVPGVGRVKAERYGQVFLDTIISWKAGCL